MVAVAVAGLGLVVADYFGPRWLLSMIVSYRGAGIVVVDESLSSGIRIDVVTFAINPGSFGDEIKRELLFVPRLTGQAGLAMSTDHARLLDLSTLNCEIIVMPRGWRGAELPRQVPLFRQGMLDSAEWTRLEKPMLNETWFVPGPGSAFSMDRLKRRHDYTIRVNLNGRVEPAAGVTQSDLPDRIPVRLVIW